MKPALFIIDLQKEYYNDDTKPSIDAACEYINAVLPLFRERNLPIIWVQDVDEEDGVKPGTVGFELISSVVPQPGEHRIHKHYGNAFNKTECQSILSEQYVDTAIITGFSAEYCVLSTYRGALDHDLTPVVLRNAIASADEEAIRFVEKVSDVISFNVLRKLLGS